MTRNVLSNPMTREFERGLWSNEFEFNERLFDWSVTNQKLKLNDKPEEKYVSYGDTERINNTQLFKNYLGIDNLNNCGCCTYKPSPLGGGDLQWVQKYSVEKISNNRYISDILETIIKVLKE